MVLPSPRRAKSDHLNGWYFMWVSPLFFLLCTLCSLWTSHLKEVTHTTHSYCFSTFTSWAHPLLPVVIIYWTLTSPLRITSLEVASTVTLVIWRPCPTVWPHATTPSVAHLASLSKNVPRALLTTVQVGLLDQTQTPEVQGLQSQARTRNMVGCKKHTHRPAEGTREIPGDQQGLT